MTFQLTPLLDLLLIVIFAQFMEVRETTEQQETLASQKIASAVEDLDTAQAELDKITDELEAKREELQDLATSSKKAIDDKNTLRKALETVQNERDAIAGLFPELFNVDEETMQKFIREREVEGVRLTKEQLQELRNEFRRLAVITPAKAAEHLMTYAELKKRVDIWRLHVDADQSTTLTVGKNTIKFRALTADLFEQEMIERIRGLPQPKSTVLLMVTFDNIGLKLHQQVLDGVTAATIRLNRLTNSSVFHTAIIGLSVPESEE
jgi:hypothetical protein